jgi:hypothetical protein
MNNEIGDSYLLLEVLNNPTWSSQNQIQQSTTTTRGGGLKDASKRCVNARLSSNFCISLSRLY